MTRWEMTVRFYLSRALPVCVLIAALVCVAGCKSAPTKKTEPPATPQPSKEPLADVVLKVNDEAWAVAGAAVYDQGTSTRYLELSTVAIPCALYEPGGRAVREGERTLRADIVALLQPDGSMVTKVIQVEVADRVFMDVTGVTLGEPNAKTGEVPFVLGQDMALPPNDFLKWPAVSVSMRGEGRARCSAGHGRAVWSGRRCLKRG